MEYSNAQMPNMNMMGMPYCPMMQGMDMYPYMQMMPNMMYPNMQMMPNMMYPNMQMMPGMMNPFEMKRIDDTDELEFEDDDDETRAPQNLEEIYRKIERNYPMIFKRLTAYGVPEFAARRIVRRIIYLTLLYER
jgi:hypothetical protein